MDSLRQHLGDPVLRIIRDHSKLSEYVEHYEKTITFRHLPRAWSEVEKIALYFRKDIVRHFRFEEDFVFPVIRERLATPANLELMARLKADHTEILSLLRDFTRHVADNTIPLDEKNTAQASRIGEKIIARMQQHAVREDDRLIPLIRMNLPLFRAQVEEK